MDSKIKDDIQRRAFDYLNKNLDEATKRSLSGQQLREILRCIADWLYAERTGAMIEMADHLVKKITKTKDAMVEETKPVTPAPDFMHDLEKL
jgi:hypothetical protein